MIEQFVGKYVTRGTGNEDAVAVPLFVSVRRRSPAIQASIWHRLAPSGIGAGIS